MKKSMDGWMVRNIFGQKICLFWEKKCMNGGEKKKLIFSVELMSKKHVQEV